jgi:hypothetical protein
MGPQVLVLVDRPGGRQSAEHDVGHVQRNLGAAAGDCRFVLAPEQTHALHSTQVAAVMMDTPRQPTIRRLRRTTQSRVVPPVTSPLRLSWR